MARFSRHRIKKGTAPQTVWKKIKDLLVTHETVEVVVVTETATNTEFELRAWNGVRRDGSNGPTATPGTDY